MSVERAYARWATVYDLVFGAVFDAGRRAAIAVAEGQSYPPSLDPNKVKLTDKIAALPAFDPTGTMKSLTFADPVYWAKNEDAWTKQWDRVSKGA